MAKFMFNLEKISEFHYKSYYGYFLFKESSLSEGRWVFIPFEKEFTEDQLMDVILAFDFLDSKKQNENKTSPSI